MNRLCIRQMKHLTSYHTQTQEKKNAALEVASLEDKKASSRSVLTPAGSLQITSAALSWLMHSWSQTGHVLMSFSRTLMPGEEKQFLRAAGWPSWVSSCSASPLSEKGLEEQVGFYELPKACTEQRNTDWIKGLCILVVVINFRLPTLDCLVMIWNLEGSTKEASRASFHPVPVFSC